MSSKYELPYRRSQYLQASFLIGVDGMLVCTACMSVPSTVMNVLYCTICTVLYYMYCTVLHIYPDSRGLRFTLWILAFTYSSTWYHRIHTRPPSYPSITTRGLEPPSSSIPSFDTAPALRITLTLACYYCTVHSTVLYHDCTD